MKIRSILAAVVATAGLVAIGGPATAYVPGQNYTVCARWTFENHPDGAAYDGRYYRWVVNSQRAEDYIHDVDAPAYDNQNCATYNAQPSIPPASAPVIRSKMPIRPVSTK